MKKEKIEVLYKMETEFPFAGKDLIYSKKEWKRIYGYEVGLLAGAKFIKHDLKEKLDVLINTK